MCAVKYKFIVCLLTVSLLAACGASSAKEGISLTLADGSKVVLNLDTAHGLSMQVFAEESMVVFSDSEGNPGMYLKFYEPGAAQALMERRHSEITNETFGFHMVQMTLSDVDRTQVYVALEQIKGLDLVACYITNYDENVFRDVLSAFSISVDS